MVLRIKFGNFDTGWTKLILAKEQNIRGKLEVINITKDNSKRHIEIQYTHSWNMCIHRVKEINAVILQWDNNASTQPQRLRNKMSSARSRIFLFKLLANEVSNILKYYRCQSSWSPYRTRHEDPIVDGITYLNYRTRRNVFPCWLYLIVVQTVMHVTGEEKQAIIGPRCEACKLK